MRDLGIPQGQLEQLEQEVLCEGRRRGSSGRQPLPKALPRERIEHALPEQERCCTACGVELTKIREEVPEQLDYTPASFQIIEHVRGVFACKSCEETMVRAPKPAQAIEKGLPGPGLLAQVVVSKYADHQPLYRPAQIYGRHGVTRLSRSTLCDWIAETAEAGQSPSSTGCGAISCGSRIVQTGRDTPVTVLDDRGGTHKGRLWVYLGDRGHPHIVYDYTPTREGSGPTRFLNGFRGVSTGRCLFGVRRALCLRLCHRGRMLDPCSSLLSRGRDRRWGHTGLRGLGVHSSALCGGTRGQRKGT